MSLLWLTLGCLAAIVIGAFIGAVLAAKLVDMVSDAILRRF